MKSYPRYYDEGPGIRGLRHLSTINGSTPICRMSVGPAPTHPGQGRHKLTGQARAATSGLASGSCDAGRMAITNPWLAGPAPERMLDREQLEERILNLLSTHNICVIATVNADGSPAATPVRYFHLGFEIFYTSWDASTKSRNLRRDPRVSAGIVAPLVGQVSSRGAQLFGTARTIQRDHPDADGYWAAVRWQSDHVERGRDLTVAPDDPLTIITPARIVYTDHWLRRTGHAPRQIWRPANSAHRP